MVVATFPDRPLRLIVAASHGSAADILARAVAPPLSARLCRPVNVELHQGENGVAGARLVAQSRPDGHTLFMTSLHIHAVGPSLHAAPPYDVIKDFSPISLVARCPLLLAVNPSVPAHTLEELTLLARERAGALTFASSAIGGSPHLAAALYQKMTGVSMKHVCYERTLQLYADLVEGRISLSFNNIMSMLPLLSADKLRGIAVTGTTRSSVVPHLPTVAESGLPGYEVTNWLGIVAPAGVDAEVITTLNDAVATALQSAGVKQDFVACGMEIVASSAAEFARHIRSELTKWAPLVKERIAQNS